MGLIMSEYRCSQCKTVYSRYEYDQLDRVPLNPDADNPEQKGGYEKVCECGARFHSDKWQIRSDFEIDTFGEFYVSTVALSIPHGLNHNQWYESLIGHKHGNHVERRYETQDEAEAGHEELVDKLKAEEFGFEAIQWRLVIEDDE